MSYRRLYLQDAGKIVRLVEKDRPCARVFGVPYDSTSSYRPGSKFAPHTIRNAFNNIEIYSRLFNVDLEKEYVEDLGDMVTALDVGECLNQVSKVCSELLREGIVFCMLGGEHTISYGAISELPEDVGIIIFDAHLDLRDEMGGSKFTHATFFRRLLEKVESERFLHVGARAACAEEWKFLEEAGVNAVEASNFTVEHVLGNRFFERFEKVYISIDVDFFDPAYAPGVGNPEPCGPSPAEFLEVVSRLPGTNVVGFDIVEVCPPYDNGNTSILAAKLMMEIISYSLRRSLQP